MLRSQKRDTWTRSIQRVIFEWSRLDYAPEKRVYTSKCISFCKCIQCGLEQYIFSKRTQNEFVVTCNRTGKSYVHTESLFSRAFALMCCSTCMGVYLCQKYFNPCLLRKKRTKCNGLFQSQSFHNQNFMVKLNSFSIYIKQCSLHVLVLVKQSLTHVIVVLQWKEKTRRTCDR
jgi:hypothetical protein